MGMDRDKELESLQRELMSTPHIETPDQTNVVDGSICWLDARRVCGPACIAYNFDGLGVEEDAVVQGHTQCILLVSRQPQGLGELVAISRKVLDHLEQQRRVEASLGKFAVPGTKG